MDDGVSGVTPWCHAACAKSGSAFVTPDTNSYLYNARSELTNATAAVDTSYRYTYNFDDIGNRETSSERGTNSVYTASQLNQYTTVDDFTPTYDADGNQTVVKTATGIWQITYNGENRPVRWTQGDTVITMSFDRMGRRVTKNDQRFVYNGYLQICNYNSSTSTSHFNYYIWDPTEPVATRPLAWTTPTTNHESPITNFYTHDGNKNVSEVIAFNNDVAAHYEYAPFGAVTVSRGTSATANPWRFSSEYAEDETATVYYNYRHYEPVTGRWLQRDPIGEEGGLSMYLFVDNDTVLGDDYRGLFDWKIGDTSDRFDLGKKGTVVSFHAYSHYTEQFTSVYDIAVAGADWDISVTCMCTNRTDVSKPVWTVASASGWWNPVRHIRDEASYRTPTRLKIIHDAEDQHINDHKQSLVGGALKKVVEDFLASKIKYFKLTKELCEKENTKMLRQDVSNQLSVEVLVSHTKWDVGNGREHEVDWD